MSPVSNSTMVRFVVSLPLYKYAKRKLPACLPASLPVVYYVVMKKANV
jgi:hypothetical protein